MKRKDYITIAGAIVFILIICFANSVVAHDGPERCPPKAECEIV